MRKNISEFVWLIYKWFIPSNINNYSEHLS